MSNKSLKNKHVVVIGASSGMGKEASTKLLELGAKVSICARRETELEKIANINKSNCFYQSVDVSDKLVVESFAKQAIELFGEVDYVINTAGVMYYQKLVNKNYDEWLKTVEVNVIGLLNIVNAFIDSVVKTQGMFVSVTSDAGRQAFPGLAVYSGSKAFMEFMLKGLRHELVDKGVRVVNIQPGNVATPLQNISKEADAIQEYKSADESVFLHTKDIANSIIYAMTQPKNVAINEILIEPQSEPI